MLLIFFIYGMVAMVNYNDKIKVIVFGVGNYFRKREKDILQQNDFEIIAFADNNENLWKERIYNIPILSPDTILKINYDFIIIMSIYTSEIVKQLLGMGIEKEKIIFGDKFLAERKSGQIKIYSIDKKGMTVTRKVLIISTFLNYNGGSLAAVYAASALEDRKMQVVLMSPGGDKKFIDEIVQSGITVAICPVLPYLFEKELNWIEQFDLVIVNVLSMILCASVLSLRKPVVWWIHESADVYTIIFEKFKEYSSIDSLKGIKIYAVSKIPQNIFNEFFQRRVDGILNYGIPDMNHLTVALKKNKLVFAIIGTVSEIKGHDVFFEAIEKIGKIDNVEFWVIGAIKEDTFVKKVVEKLESNPLIKVWGELTRSQIYDLFPYIDVVVCSSRIDSLPIAITEGMMYGKVCITTYGTGIADYICNEKNGFIVSAEDADALREKIEWIIVNKDKLKEIGINARKTYEKYFNMEVFGRNLENILMETEVWWNKKFVKDNKEN